METTPRILKLYRRLSELPAGKWLFALAVCFKAPYFGSIRPRVEVLEPGCSVWSMKKRRAVTNHLGTVHALAMGNLAEICAGLLMEVSLSPQRRWIPTGMEISYLKKAETDLTGVATVSTETMRQLGDVPVKVEVKDTQGTVVVRATIHMHVSERPVRTAKTAEAA